MSLHDVSYHWKYARYFPRLTGIHRFQKVYSHNTVYTASYQPTTDISSFSNYLCFMTFQAVQRPTALVVHVHFMYTTGHSRSHKAYVDAVRTVYIICTLRHERAAPRSCNCIVTVVGCQRRPNWSISIECHYRIYSVWVDAQCRSYLFVNYPNSGTFFRLGGPLEVSIKCHKRIHRLWGDEGRW